MSNHITNLCRPLKLTPPQKCVLMALADRADDSGVAWPSISWLCEWTCFGKTAVINALKGLEEDARLITNVRTTGRNNRCLIHLQRVTELNLQAAQAPASQGAFAAHSSANEEGDLSASRTNPSATRTSPPDAPVRETHHHQSATRTTTSPPGAPTSPPDAPDTSITIIETPNKTSNSCVIGAANGPAPSLFTLEPVDPQPASSTKPKHEYTPEFEAAWVAYPDRPGDSKQAAFKQWLLRLKAGATAEEMAAGIVAYAAYVDANGTEQRFVKHAATFLGPDMHFRSSWAVAPQTGQGSRFTPGHGQRESSRERLRHTGFDQLDYTAGVNADGTLPA